MKKPSYSGKIDTEDYSRILAMYGDIDSPGIPTAEQVAALLHIKQPLSQEQMDALQAPEFEEKIVETLEAYKKRILGIHLHRANRGKSIPSKIRFQTPEKIYDYLDQAQASALEYQKKVRLAEAIQTGQARVVYGDDNHGKILYDAGGKIIGEIDAQGKIVGNVLEGYEIAPAGQVIERLSDVFIPAKDPQGTSHMVRGYTGWGSKNFSLRTQPIESMGKTRTGTAWYILALEEWHKPIFISSEGDDILGSSMQVVNDIYFSKRSENNDFFGKQCVRDVDTNIGIEIPLDNIASADFEGGVIVLKEPESYSEYSHLGNIIIRPSSRRKGKSIFSGREYFIDLQAFKDLCAAKAAKARRKLDPV